MIICQFYIKVHGISPACFRLIQSSNCLNLPHERNLLIIKNSIGFESEYLCVLKGKNLRCDAITAAMF